MLINSVAFGLHTSLLECWNHESKKSFKSISHSGVGRESRLIFWTPAFSGAAPASAISAVKHSAGDFALNGSFLC